MKEFGKIRSLICVNLVYSCFKNGSIILHTIQHLCQCDIRVCVFVCVCLCVSIVATKYIYIRNKQFHQIQSLQRTCVWKYSSLAIILCAKSSLINENKSTYVFIRIWIYWYMNIRSLTIVTFLPRSHSRIRCLSMLMKTSTFCGNSLNQTFVSLSVTAKTVKRESMITLPLDNAHNNYRNKRTYRWVSARKT